MAERIRLFYSKGLWTAAMVRQAVGKGLLTEAQYRQIVGQPEDGGGQESGPSAPGSEEAANG